MFGHPLLRTTWRCSHDLNRRSNRPHHGGADGLSIEGFARLDSGDQGRAAIVIALSWKQNDDNCFDREKCDPLIKNIIRLPLETAVSGRTLIGNGAIAPR